MNRTAIYIDNSNVFKNIYKIRNTDGDKSWCSLYDPLKLGQILSGNRTLTKVNFYCVPPPAWLLQGNDEQKQKHSIAMRYYTAVGKLNNVEVKYGYLQGDKNNLVEKNVDTQLATDMVSDAALGLYDTAILVSNDGDYKSAIETAKKLGKRVEVLFFKGHMSGALKQACDLPRKARKSYFQRMPQF